LDWKIFVVVVVPVSKVEEVIEGSIPPHQVERVEKWFQEVFDQVGEVGIDAFGMAGILVLVPVVDGLVVDRWDGRMLRECGWEGFVLLRMMIGFEWVGAVEEAMLARVSLKGLGVRSSLPTWWMGEEGRG
jgi:hypothetical protein